MKNLTLLLIALTAVLSIAGCGAKKDDKAAEDGVATIKAAEDSVTTIKATMTAESKEKFVEETTAESKEELVEETTGSDLTVDANVVSETTEEEKAYEEHTIEKGENLLYICKKYYGDAHMVKEVMKLNGIEDMDSIYEGQVIKLPLNNQ